MGRLSEYGLLDVVDNPHGKSHKYTWIKLTPSGRKLQKLFIGSEYWKDKPRLQLDRTVKSTMNGGIYD